MQGLGSSGQARRTFWERQGSASSGECHQTGEQDRVTGQCGSMVRTEDEVSTAEISPQERGRGKLDAYGRSKESSGNSRTAST